MMEQPQEADNLEHENQGDGNQGANIQMYVDSDIIIKLLGEFFTNYGFSIHDNYLFRELSVIKFARDMFDPSLSSIPGRHGYDCRNEQYSNGEIKCCKGSMLRSGMPSFAGGPMIDIRSYGQGVNARDNIREKLLSWNILIFSKFSDIEKPLWVFYIYGRENCNYVVNTYFMEPCMRTQYRIENGEKAAQTTISDITNKLLNSEFPQPENNKLIILNKDSHNERTLYNLHEINHTQFTEKITEIYNA